MTQGVLYVIQRTIPERHPAVEATNDQRCPTNIGRLFLIVGHILGLTGGQHMHLMAPLGQPFGDLEDIRDRVPDVGGKIPVTIRSFKIDPPLLLL